MDIYVLDQNRKPFAIIDQYDSLIWTDRYDDMGDFEFYTKFDPVYLDIFQKDFYLKIPVSNRTMIIEDWDISSDVENGVAFKATGRSLESLLSRRIVWNQTRIQGSVQNGIQKLLNRNAISPSNDSRKIPNLSFQVNNDEDIVAMDDIDAQFTGDNLFDAIQSMCKAYDLGFRILMNSDLNFVFSLYNADDRSFGNPNNNQYVIFSPDFDNLLDSQYKVFNSTSKNVAHIGGQGEGEARQWADVGNASGMDRRELYVDANDISNTYTNEETNATVAVDEIEYKEQLKQRGKEKLAEVQAYSTFEGEADIEGVFRYGTDFFLGDTVQIRNEYGIESRSRVVEITFSQDPSKITAIPTFRAV